MKRSSLISFYVAIVAVSCICGYFVSKPILPRKYNNPVFPYYYYCDAWLGDTAEYNKVVRRAQRIAPSHPDYLDLSFRFISEELYTPAYYNAYKAIHDLYEYNHYEHMGAAVKRMMYSYLQLAIKYKDPRVTEQEKNELYREYPAGIDIKE